MDPGQHHRQAVGHQALQDRLRVWREDGLRPAADPPQAGGRPVPRGSGWPGLQHRDPAGLPRPEQRRGDQAREPQDPLRPEPDDRLRRQARREEARPVTLARIAGLLTAAALLTACGGGSDTGTQQSAPTSVSLPATVPAVAKPLSIAKVQYRTCGLLSDEQIAAFLTAPLRSEYQGSVSCVWIGTGRPIDARIDLQGIPGEPLTLHEAYDEHKKNPSFSSRFEPATVAGYPALRLGKVGSRDANDAGCRVAVALADNQPMLHAHLRIWDAGALGENPPEPCAWSEQLAAEAIKALQAKQ
ncbi:DUF3558 domain-containing protein [Pseudonocardiaceae bacterium YIM PH 21723]|nr:DUF3558 domain-containing protein [Pseudonocardiaceae bacterium YIM PH 21723]